MVLQAIRARQDATVRLQELLVTVNDLDRVLSLKSEYHAQYEVSICCMSSFLVQVKTVILFSER